jgi:hypothetical protein
MSPTDAHLAAYARLYGPSAEELRRSLPEHGDSLQGQLHELAKRPSVERCETAIRNLGGIVQVLNRYRERLVAEGTGDDLQ